MDRGYYNLVVFLDLKKAFDTEAVRDVNLMQQLVDN